MGHFSIGRPHIGCRYLYIEFIMKYYLIDGYNLAFRCFYAMPDLSRSDGFPTGALHAFFASLLNLSSSDTPHSTVVFFDKGGSKRHLEIYPEYKANRAETPENFRRQIPQMKYLCELFGFEPTESEGIEADDLLASAAVKLKAEGNAVTIVSADKDFAQLVSPNIRQLLPPKPRVKEWTELDTVGVKTKFGVTPAQIPAYLALVGDSADNIGGIEGVGPKTAAKWLKDFGDIETLLRRADWIKPERFRKIVADSADLLKRNLALVTLDTSIDISPKPAKVPDFPEIIKFLEEMEMKKSLFSLRNFAKDQYQISI